jgi:peptidyl-prolyl cis-trans isomerase C
MRKTFRPWLAIFALAGATLPALAQQPSATAPRPATLPVPTAARPAAPAPNAVAATVNGQPILEAAVQRGLRRVPPNRHAEIRPEILNFLIDNTLIDQYLLQMRIAVDPRVVEQKIAQMKTEMKKEKIDYERMLKENGLTDAELRGHITSDLRWNKYAEAQATDKALKTLFDSNKDMFDGSMCRVRHILITPDWKDTKSIESAKAQLAAIKKDIESKVAAGLAKLPPNADNLAKEQARVKLIEDAFSAAAKAKSACPSKQQGGDVGWFDRAGTMVEPFARAAFALKRFQMSDVVQTPFGFHLILLLDRKPGKDIKFEQAKAEIKEVYCERLRDSLAYHLRQKGKIVVK